MEATTKRLLRSVKLNSAARKGSPLRVMLSLEGAEPQSQDPRRPTGATLGTRVTLPELLSTVGLHENHFNHIGDVECYRGIVFLPVSGPGGRNIIMAVDESFRVIGWANVPQFYKAASSCAIHPWNGYLYTLGDRDGGKNEVLTAFDVRVFYEALANGREWGQELALPIRDRSTIALRDNAGRPMHFTWPQGIAFSSNGRLYLTTSPKSTFSFSNYITAFDPVTGRCLGPGKEINFPGVWDEIEGITVHPNGVLYVSVLVNGITESRGTLGLYALWFKNLAPSAV